MKNNFQLATNGITPQENGTTPSRKRSGVKCQMHNSMLPTPTKTNTNIGMNANDTTNAPNSLRHSLARAFTMASHVRTPPIVQSSATAVKVMAKTSFGSDIKIR